MAPLLCVSQEQSCNANANTRGVLVAIERNDRSHERTSSETVSAQEQSLSVVDSGSSSRKSSSRALLLAAGVVLSGAVNEISGRIRAVPLDRFDVFVSLANSGIQLVVYALLVGLLLLWGRIPKANVAFLRRSSSLRLLAVVGFLDSAGSTMGFIAQPYVPGPIFPLLTQTIVPFSCVFSLLFLGRRYSLLHFAALVITFSGFLVAWCSIPHYYSAVWSAGVSAVNGAADAKAAGAALAAAATAAASASAAAAAAGAGAKREQRRFLRTPFPADFPTVYEPSGGTSSSVEGDNCGGSRQAWMAALVALSTAPTALSFVFKEFLAKTYEREYQQHRRRVQEGVLQEATGRLLPLLLQQRQQQERLEHETILDEEQLRQGRGSNDAENTSEETADSSKLHLLLICFCATFFALLWCIVVTPLNAYLIKKDGESVAAYLLNALRCFSGHGENCSAAVPAYISYVTANLIFNLFIMALLLHASSLLCFVAMKAILPVSLLLYAAGKWPLLPKNDSNITAPIVISLLLITTGILSFHFETVRCSRTYRNQNPPCCWPASSFFWIVDGIRSVR